MAHDPAFVALCDDARSRIREMTLDDLLDRQGRGVSLLLVDVREDREWSQGHMPHAVHLGKGVLERDIATIAAPDDPIVLYCGGGYRSALAADALQRMGATDAELVEDGKAAVYFAGNAVGPGGRERSFHTVVAMSGHLQVIAADPTSAANAAATLLQLVEIQDGTCA